LTTLLEFFDHKRAVSQSMQNLSARIERGWDTHEHVGFPQG
jgi:hypothetical protein